MIIRALHLAALESVTRTADQKRGLQYAIVDPEGETGGPCAVATTGTILISVPVEFPEGAPEGMRIFRPHKPVGRRTAEIEIPQTELQDRVAPFLRGYRTVIAPKETESPEGFRPSFDPRILNLVTRVLKGGITLAPHGRDNFRVVFHEHPGVLCIQAVRRP